MNNGIDLEQYTQLVNHTKMFIDEIDDMTNAISVTAQQCNDALGKDVIAEITGSKVLDCIDLLKRAKNDAELLLNAISNKYQEVNSILENYL